jgi:hypothetical protein
MGLATHNPSGEVRLGLRATAASAVLYGAVVLFGAGSPSPVALDVGGSARHASVVLIPKHADTVPGPVQKLPQASPGPRRHGSQTRPHPRRPAFGSTTSPVGPNVESPPPPTPQPPRVPTRVPTKAPAPQAGDRSADPVAEPLLNVAIPTVTVPELPLLPPAPPLAPPVTVSLQLPG